MMPSPIQPHCSPGRSTWSIVGCMAIMLIALHVAVGPFVRISEWRVPGGRGEESNSIAANTNFLEALAWRSGRLDLPLRVHDSAMHQGRVYNVNPPLFTLLSYVALTLSDWTGGPADEFPTPWYVALVALPLPLLGYWAFLRATNDPRWAGFFTFSWIAGTAVLPCLIAARDGGICQIDHLLSQIGLMLIAGALVNHTANVAISPVGATQSLVGSQGPPVAADCTRTAQPLGSRAAMRIACVGLLIAVLSRPTLLAFVLPVAAYAWSAGRHQRFVRLLCVCGVVLGAVGLLLTLNALRFGAPWESGYRYLYEGRIDAMAQRGRAAIFSTAYMADNLWWMNLELPGWEVGSYGIRPTTNPNGASIWFTTPVLLLALWSAREWWQVPMQRVLMLASLLPIIAFLCYHNNGYIQAGHFRYALDFAPIWLVVSSAHAQTAGRRWFAVVATAWSVLYFHMIAGMV